MSARHMQSPGVDRTLTILESLAGASEAVTLTALAQQTEIPLTTCAAIMGSLEDRGYATRKIIGRSHFWRLTTKLYALASRVQDDNELSTVAMQEMKLLAERLRFPVHIGVLNGKSIVYVAKAQSPGFVQFDTYPGKVAPFHLTALGRAIAAFLTPDEIDLVARDLAPPRGASTGPGGVRARLMLQLEEVRRRGYATEFDEDQVGVSCVAAAFFGADGNAVGAVGITALTADLDALLEVTTTSVSELARLISFRLGHADGVTQS